MRYVAEKCELGDVVIFGRDNGEKTVGKVVRINAATYTIEALEERGTKRTHKAGGKWRVAKKLVRLRDRTLTTPEPKRSDAEIIAELRNIESRLSPENLFMDGERSRTAARREERKLIGIRKQLIRELGREPSMDELWGAS
jgi:hypothetical protein